MADDTFSVDQLKEATEWAQKHKVALDDVLQWLGKVFDMGGKTGEVLKRAAQAGAVGFHKMTESLAEFKHTLNEIKEIDLRNLSNPNEAKAFDNMADSFAKLLALGVKFDAFSHSQVAHSSNLRTMSEQYETLTKKAQSFGGMQKMFSAFGLGSVGKVLGVAEEKVDSYLQAASNMQALGNSYVNLNMLSGQSNKIFNSSGAIFNNLNEQVAEYNSFLHNSAVNTGAGIQKTTELANSLGLVPNVLHKMIDSGGGAGKTVDGLTTALTLAKGAGVEVSIVTDVMTKAYEDLGQAQGAVTDNAEKGFHMFGVMAQATQDLGLRFNDTRGFLEHVATTFQNVGDNTDGATKMLYNFTGALQNTGLTAKSSINIVEHMVGQLGKLSMGTKALISARSGGPGGLQGAFKMENLLREGKVDEVSNMMQRTLKQQFGGRIYTAKEAEGSPQAAAQFMRQRTMLQSGAFGSLAKDPETATRLLEAMKQGPAATATQLKDAMKNTAEQGNKLQQAQNTTLDLINNAMERSIAIEQAHFLLVANKALGGGYDQEVQSKVQEEIEKMRGQSVERSQELGAHFKNKSFVNPQENTQTELRYAGNLFKGAASTAPEVGKILKEEITGIIRGSVEGVKAIKTMRNEKAEGKEAQDKASRVKSIPMNQMLAGNSPGQSKYSDAILDEKMKLIDQYKTQIPDIYKMVQGGHKENVPAAMKSLYERIKMAKNMEQEDKDPEAFKIQVEKEDNQKEFTSHLSRATRQKLAIKKNEDEENTAMTDNSMFTSPLLNSKYMKKASDINNISNTGYMQKPSDMNSMTNTVNAQMRNATRPGLHGNVQTAAKTMVENKLTVDVRVSAADGLKADVKTTSERPTNVKVNPGQDANKNGMMGGVSQHQNQR